MSRLVLLNNDIHKNVRVNTAIAEAQGGLLNMVPVMLSEFLKLAVQFPIAITKNKETGQFVVVALFGFQAGENLFFNNNRWNSLYTPLHIVRQPFFLGEDNASKNADKQFVICIDTDNNSIQQHDGDRLFDTEGKETAYLEKIKYVLSELLEGEEKTKAFIAKLLSLKLLQAMQLEITFENGESVRVEGMYTINEDNLQNLSPESLAELNQLEYLRPIYTMIVSLGHIYGLIEKKNKLNLSSAN